MQNGRTLQFWDDYHNENTSKEWILQPTADLLETIHSHSPQTVDSISRWLEIGCGTSTMARDLWKHIKEKESGENAAGIHMCATDVSEVCIQVNRERDTEYTLEVNSNSGSSSTLEYRVFNVVDEEPSDNLRWNVILDKGCLDTFLFRSRQRGENHIYSTLVGKVLDNIWRLLEDDGVYMLISPRARLRSVRDYAGFDQVQRYALKDASEGALVGTEKNTTSRKTPGYIYLCTKKLSYEVGKAEPFAIGHRDLPKEDDECPKCGITFMDLRKGQSIDGQGVVFWTRQWKGHCTHCKGIKESKE